MNKGKIQIRFGFLMVLLLCILLTGKNAHADSAYSYILPDSSWRTYSEAEIADMPLQVLCYAKNEIYARNGRMFVSGELQNYFNNQYWYCPLYRPEQFTPSMLNTYETANVGLLDRRERALGTYTLDAAGYSYYPVYNYINSHYGSYAYYSTGVNPDSYIFYDSDSRYLTDQEIYNLTQQELCYARNEIYARRGRTFLSTELQNYFNQKNWYWGIISPSAFSDAIFNSYESTNVAKLANLENSRGAYVLDQPGYSYSTVGSYTSYHVYTPTTSDYIFWDSNIRYLSDAEVAYMSIQQLCYARNEIYARRGYIFNSQELRDYFGSKTWYFGTIPSSYFSSSVFNQYEMSNVELLKRYEFAINPNGYQLY